MNLQGRAAVAVRYLLLTFVLVVAVGVGGRLLSWPLLTSTVGPTAYVFAASPRSEAARVRNAVIGHVVAIGVGVTALFAFGLVHQPAVSSDGYPSWKQIGASALAVGATLLVLELAASHHAPSAATTLLITTGLAKPGAPLIGLALGLAIVITLGPLFGRWPFARKAVVREKKEERPEPISS